MIKRLTENNLHQAAHIIEQCRIDLDARNIPQWVPQYPNQDDLKMDINKQELYGYFEDQLLGIIAFHDRQDPEYRLIDWAYTEPVITVHRLAVLPFHQGKGIARALMDFCETYTIQNGYSSIRLDAFTKNPSALHFYEKRNYRLSGIVFFKFRKHPFYGYELDLKHKKRIESNDTNTIFDKKRITDVSL